MEEKEIKKAEVVEEIKPTIFKEFKEAEERTMVHLPLCTYDKEKGVICSEEGVTLTYLKTERGNVLESMQIQYPKDVIAVTRPEKPETPAKEVEEAKKQGQ